VTMSQPDPLTELRANRPVAPAALRDHVRLLTASRPAPPRRITWRRGLLVLAPTAVAVVALGIAVRGDGTHTRAADQAVREPAPLTKTPAGTVTVPFSAATPQAALGDRAGVPSNSGKRLQDYEAYLRLRVKDGDAVSAATQRAISVARSLGGYPVSVDVANGGRDGDATLTLRVPVTHVQEAVARLSALGTILGERVSIQDVQGGVNAVDRQIARLQRRLRELRAQDPTDRVKRQIEALTQEVQRLQRNRAATVRQARLATVSVELTTRRPEPPAKSESGPLDGAWTALRWIGIGALFALIVGGPFVVLGILAFLAWRIARRRAEARLLASS
jgi:Domain of unknown function (DUF4349)